MQRSTLEVIIINEFSILFLCGGLNVHVPQLIHCLKQVCFAKKKFEQEIIIKFVTLTCFDSNCAYLCNFHFRDPQIQVGENCSYIM